MQSFIESTQNAMAPLIIGISREHKTANSMGGVSAWMEHYLVPPHCGSVYWLNRLTRVSPGQLIAGDVACGFTDVNLLELGVFIIIFLRDILLDNGESVVWIVDWFNHCTPNHWKHVTPIHQRQPQCLKLYEKKFDREKSTYKNKSKTICMLWNGY